MPNEIRTLADRMEDMSADERTHFRDVIEELSFCYGEAGAQAIVVVGESGSTHAKLVFINCDDMDAAVLFQSAKQHIDSLNEQGKPPKEMLN